MTSSTMAVTALSYLLAVIACDYTAHEMVYPIVGWGRPLTGGRRWLVCIFSPFIVIGLWCAIAPMVALVIFAMWRYSRK